MKYETIFSIIYVCFGLLIFGCGEETESPIAEKTAPEGAMNTLGEMKIPQGVAAAPQAPNIGAPSIKEISYYSNWKLTEPIDSATAGDTIYTKVVFSEPMLHIAANDKTARPVLYYRIGRQNTRYRISAHGAKGEAFQSGDAKPKGKSRTVFICKYTIQAEDAGTLTLAVGKLSTDTEGTALAKFYTHKEQLSIEEPDTTPPFVRSVTYWYNERLTDPIADTVYDGETIYTKIVFSKAMEVVEGSSNQSRPILYHQIGRKRTRYRIITDGRLRNNEAKTEDSITFICKNTIMDVTNTTLRIMVGKFSLDRAGNTLSEFYRHKERVQLKMQPPIVESVGSRVKDVNRRPSVRLVYFHPKNHLIQQDKVETLRALAADANKYYADEMQRHGFGRKTFAVETDADGVPIVHVIRGRFSENYYRPTGKHHRGVYTARGEILEHFPDGPQHIYFFMMDLTRNALVRDVSDQSCAFGGLHFADDEKREKEALGGYLILPASGGCSENLPLTMHELGHAFGLHHDFREGRASNRIMAYGRQTHLSRDAAEWLSVSVFFNDTIPGISPGKITMVPNPEHTPQGVQVSFQAEDPDGLHKMQLLFGEGSGYTLIDFEPLQGLTDTVEFVSPKLARKFTDRIILQIIDDEGGITQMRFPPVD